MRSFVYSFPEVTLKPGEIGNSQIELKGPFRANKLVFSASMKEIRGQYRIKYSRLPLLDREVVASSESRILKWSNGKVTKYRRGKTTVRFFLGDRYIVRDYRPENVLYIPTEPLEYIQLRNVFCGVENGLAPGPGISPALLNAGWAPHLPTATHTMTVALENVGDVVIRVRASVLGYAL